MALTVGTPGDWGPGALPVPVTGGSRKGQIRPENIKIWPAGPVKLSTGGAGK